MGCGKKEPIPPFHDSIHNTFTIPWKPKPPHSDKDFSGVFHKFPTPYYGYYNKFNKIDRFGNCFQTPNNIRTGKQKGENSV